MSPFSDNESMHIKSGMLSLNFNNAFGLMAQIK